jgi:hypothetical protein
VPPPDPFDFTLTFGEEFALAFVLLLDPEDPFLNNRIIFL